MTAAIQAGVARRSSVWQQMLALARRDLATELSYQFQFIMRLFSIVFTIAPFFFIAKMVDRPSALYEFGGGYFEFVLVGLAVRTYMRLGLGTFGQAIQYEQTMGTLEMLFASPVRMWTVLAGTFVLPMARITIEVAVYFAAGILIFGAQFEIVRLVLAIPVLALTAASFCAIGIFSAGFIVLTKRGDPFSFAAREATSLLAGVVFPVTLMPAPLQWLSNLIPATYGIDGVRRIMLSGASLVDVLDDVAALGVFVVVLLPLSLWSFTIAARYARRTGTLGNY